MMRPPRSFRVLGQRFSVRVVPRDEHLVKGIPDGAVGATDVERQRVFLRNAGPGGLSEHQQVETMFHEAMHAIVYTAGLRHLFDNDHEQEETAIMALSPHLLHFLRENREVTEYLLQELP